MDFVVEKMAAFKVIGFSREFLFDTSYAEIPKFWDEMSEKYGKNLSTVYFLSLIFALMRVHNMREKDITQGKV